MSKESVFLLVAAAGLTPIALAYGLLPATTVPMLYGVEIDSVNIAHIFRAVMGLYLAMVIFWILGATREPLRFAALCSVAVFMGGLASFDYAVYPEAKGKPGYEGYLTENAVTIQELLRDAGYDTYQTGK